MRRFILALLAAGLLLGLLGPPATAASFTVVQPTEKYAGKTYGQWSVAWWRWAAAAVPSPVTDATGANCAVGQRGPVWFLAGTTGGDPVNRSCTIPSGKAILFPVINGECSTVEGVPEADLVACATGQIDDYVTETSASVDGTAIDLGPPGPNARFRFTSDPLVFPITFAKENGFGVPAGTGKAAADGYWVLVKPLTVGSHTIDFHGKLVVPEVFTFETTAHYNLTVR
jgi:hypothetical protein